MNIQWEEENEFYHATDTDWDRADAYQRGSERPDLAWISTDRDVWYPNPFYKGPPIPHPETL
tara:strand:+ start:459 stop:644 length:186 start_codon:yes stop_codon:yes gene_type:complete